MNNPRRKAPPCTVLRSARRPSIFKQLPVMLLPALLALSFLLSGCQSQAAAQSQLEFPQSAPDQAAAGLGGEAAASDDPALFSNRPRYAPGELVDYTAQTGDTLPGLAVRFNTTVEEILKANSFIPTSATTMPPGMPMKIPIYYLPLWGTSYQILPDSAFVNGPAQLGFQTADFVARQPGWLASYQEFAAGANRSAAEIIDLVAIKFSLSPRLLLALLEFHSQALSSPDPSPEASVYPLGYRDRRREGLYRQLLWTANLLNDGYYAWRTAELNSLELRDGRQVRFDPWQNAATVSLHQYFNRLLTTAAFSEAIGPQGFASRYRDLFGDPWQADQAFIPGSLEQPPLLLPFEPGPAWAFTGGPHTAWGSLRPYAALDFAPPLIASGCQETDQWATAVAAGVVVRVDEGELVLDLDGDGDERTGWVIFYLHLAAKDRAPLGASLQAGQPVGHPSCEGGSSTGTHVHLARKYNGEWLPAAGYAGGMLAFNLEGWVARSGRAPYQGTLVRLSRVTTACDCSNQPSFIQADPR